MERPALACKLQAVTRREGPAGCRGLLSCDSRAASEPEFRKENRP